MTIVRKSLRPAFYRSRTHLAYSVSIGLGLGYAIGRCIKFFEYTVWPTLKLQINLGPCVQVRSQ